MRKVYIIGAALSALSIVFLLVKKIKRRVTQ